MIKGIQEVAVVMEKAKAMLDANGGLIHCNSLGTALKIAFWLLKEYDNYPYYEQAMEAFEKLPEIYGKAHEAVREDAAKFAMTYKDDVIWNVMASGVAWETAYSDALSCIQSPSSSSLQWEMSACIQCLTADTCGSSIINHSLRITSY